MTDRREPAYISRGYLCVIDEEGNEIPGSRRPLVGIRTMAEFAAARRSLERQMGEGCRVEQVD